MKAKYLFRYASLVVASLLLIIIGNRLPREED